MKKNKKNIPKKIILYGVTGQAKVVKPIIDLYGSKIIAVFDDTKNLKSPFINIPIYYGYDSLLKWSNKRNINNIGFLITIGNPHGKKRIKLHKKLCELGFVSFTIIHPSAIIDKSAKIEDGCQIMAGSVIMVDVKISKETIVNTNSNIDHECIIEEGCEVAPGATLCGKVKLRKYSWICAGATILPRITIGQNSIVGAGAVVTKNVEMNKTVVGIPAKIQK